MWLHCLVKGLTFFLTHVENGQVSASHTQPFHGPLSRTTWVGWYQKKHSPTPTHLYFIVKHPLSTSIYYYPQHPPCSIYVLGSPFPLPLSSFSLVFLGMGPSASYFMQFLRHHVQIMNFCWAFEITYNNTHFSLWYPSIYCLLKVVASGYIIDWIYNYSLLFARDCCLNLYVTPAGYGKRLRNWQDVNFVRCTLHCCEQLLKWLFVAVILCWLFNVDYLLGRIMYSFTASVTVVQVTLYVSE